MANINSSKAGRPETEVRAASYEIMQAISTQFCPMLKSFSVPSRSLFYPSFFPSEKKLCSLSMCKNNFDNNELKKKVYLGFFIMTKRKQTVSKILIKFISGFTGLTQCNPVILKISLRLSILKQLPRAPTFGMPYHFERVPSIRFVGRQALVVFTLETCS